LIPLRLKEYEHHKIMNLSGGLKMKLMLALALLGEPKIIVLDDPTSCLDADSRREFWELLTKLKAGRVVIVATQEIAEVQKYADRMCIMADGKVTRVDTPARIMQQSGGYKIIVQPKRHVMTPL